MSTDKPSWIDQMTRLFSLVTGLVTLVTTLVGFVQLWRGNLGLVTGVLLVIGLGGGLAGCAYLAFAKEPSPLVGGGKMWRYPRARRWAIAGLILIPLLTLGAVGLWQYQRSLPPKKIIVLVARFDGPEPAKYRVTETILSRLREATASYEDVEIEALDGTITEAQGSAAARALGERRKAAIVIWGWYGVTEEAVSLSVHFEVLREPKYMPEIGPEAKGRVQSLAVAELQRFELQLQLSDQMTYLTLFTVGMIHYAAGDNQAAIARFSDALNQPKERVRALDQSVVHFYRGNAYLFKGEYDRALADYDQALRLNPNLAEAYYDRGTAYAYKGEYDRAIADFDQALRLNPNLAAAYYNRGNAYLDKGEYDRAIADYDQVLRLNPEDAEAYYNRGTAYLFKGEYDRAIADYDQALRLSPEDAAAYNNRGNAYLDKGEYDRAIADYDQVLRLNPEDAEAYINRGTAYAYKGEYDRAIADFDQALRLNPNLAEAYYDRGLAHKYKGEKAQAIADFQKLLELSQAPYWRQQAEQQLQALGVEK